MSIRKALIGFVLLASASAPLYAQSSRPYRGLFAGGVGDASQILTLNTSLGAGYFEQRVGSDSPLTPSQTSTGGSEQAAGSLAYSLSIATRHVGLSVSAGGSALYYPAAASKIITSEGASVGSSFTLTRRTTLTASGNVEYSPFYFSSIGASFSPTATAFGGANAGIGGPFGGTTAGATSPYGNFIDPSLGQAVLANQDINPGVEGHWSYGTNLSLHQTLSPRVTATATYSYIQTHSSLGDFDSTGESYGGRVAVGLAPGLSASLGYSEGESWYPSGGRFESHAIDGGLNYNRALSVSRRTRLSFNTGFAGTNGGSGTSTQYGVTGSATLSREIGRSWSAAASYSRSVAFVEIFHEPAFVDAANVRLGGTLGRRVVFQSGVGASRANVGFGTQSNGVETYYGSTGIRFAVTRFAGVTGTYAYSWYSIGHSVVLPVGVFSNSTNQSVNANVSFWLPIFERSQRRQS